MDAPLLDYLGTETEGPTATGWKYPKLQDLNKFQERRGLNYSVIEEVEVQESLEGVELHPNNADEKAQTHEDFFLALRFRDSRNKLDKSPLPYIVIWTKLIGDWPSIVNGGCRFALQARQKFLDQVRILIKAKIFWNHDWILLRT